LHWTTAERFREQVGAPKSSSLRVLYKSLMPDLISMIPITALQVLADSSLRRWLGGNNRVLSIGERLVAAMFAGFVVSPLASYAEMIMLLQQKYGLTMNSARTYLWQLSGFRGIFRGLTACGIRDAFYCAAYLGVAPAIKDYAEETFQYNPYLAPHERWLPFVLAGPTGGLVAAVITQPIDCVKSRQQAMFKKVKFTEATRNIFSSEGYWGFFKGIRGRAKRVTFGVVVMSYVNDRVQERLADHWEQKSSQDL